MKWAAESYTVSVLQYILKAFGIVTDPQQHWYTKLYLSSFGVTITPGFVAQLTVLYTYESFIYNLDSLVYITVAALVASQLIVCYRRRHIFLELHQVIKSNEYMGDQFYEQCNRALQKSFFTLAIFLFVLMVLATINPILVAVLTDTEYGSPPTLIYPSTFPWKIDGTLPYIFALATEVVICVIPIIVTVAIPLYFQYIGIVLKSLSDVLQRKIKNMDALGKQFLQLKDIAADFGTTESSEIVTKKRCTRQQCECDQKMLQELHGIFRYHQFQVSFTKKVIFSVQGLAKMIVCASFIFVALLTSMFLMIDGSYIYRLKMMAVQTLACIQLWTLVSLGQLIAEMNQQVMFQIYETEWYRQSIRFQKDMIIFFGLCNNNLELRLFGTITFDRRFLSRAATKTFSCIQFIMSTQKPSAQSQ